MIGPQKTDLDVMEEGEEGEEEEEEDAFDVLAEMMSEMFAVKQVGLALFHLQLCCVIQLQLRCVATRATSRRPRSRSSSRSAAWASR